MQQPAQYFRKNKTWQNLIGQMGEVEFSTTIFVTSSELEAFLPYDFLLVRLESGKKIEIAGEAKTQFQIGDKVILELRKSAVPDAKSIIPYDLKAIKYNFA
jgi:uncharacterized OB-fold protein